MGRAIRPSDLIHQFLVIRWRPGGIVSDFLVDELAVLLTKEENDGKYNTLSRSKVELRLIDGYGDCHALFSRKILLAMSIADLVNGRPP